MNPAIKCHLLAVACALSFVSTVHARDTPSRMEPAVDERMEAARTAIQARPTELRAMFFAISASVATIDSTSRYLDSGDWK